MSNNEHTNQYSISAKVFHSFHAELIRLGSEQVFYHDASKLRQYFAHHHNFEKGETAKGELDKFFDLISKDFLYQYDEISDVYRFKKKPNVA